MRQCSDITLRMTSCGARNGSVNGTFVQRRVCELAVERYHEPLLKSLQYDMHRYWPYNIREPLSGPAVSITGEEPTRSPRVPLIAAILMPHKMTRVCAIYTYFTVSIRSYAHRGKVLFIMMYMRTYFKLKSI